MGVVILPGFEHRPGQHCGSTALADVAAYRGHPLDEATCFGLGAGLAFVYLKLPVSPYRAVVGRGPDLESAFFANLGSPLTWQSGPELDLEALLRETDRGNPVLARTDLAYLDYYATKTHFAGHAVLVAGYDEAARTVLLADTERPGLQSLSWDSLRRSMASDYPFPMPLRNEWAAIAPFPELDLPRACRKALAQTVGNALQPPDTGGLFQERAGLEGLAVLAAEVDGWWREIDNWAWTYRFAYQAMERRGTGGGNFRRLFAGFLGFAARQCPELGLADQERRWFAVADQWTDLSQTLKEISEAAVGQAPGAAPIAGAGAAAAPDPALLRRAADQVRAVSEAEGALIHELAALLR